MDNNKLSILLYHTIICLSSKISLLLQFFYTDITSSSNRSFKEPRSAIACLDNDLPHTETIGFFYLPDKFLPVLLPEYPLTAIPQMTLHSSHKKFMLPDISGSYGKSRTSAQLWNILSFTLLSLSF